MSVSLTSSWRMRLHDLLNGLCVTANGTDHWHESFNRKEQIGEAVIERYLPPLSFTRLLFLVAKVEWLKKLWRGISDRQRTTAKPPPEEAAKGTLECDEITFTQQYTLISY